MKPNLVFLTAQFAKSIEKEAAPAINKEKLSRKKMQKALEKAKEEHKRLKSQLDILENDDKKRKIQIDDTRTNHQKCRNDIIKYHRALQNSDISGSKDMVFYGDDIAYIMGDGKEYYMESDPTTGDYSLTPWAKWKKSQKDQGKEIADPVVNPVEEESTDQDEENTDLDNIDDEVEDLPEDDKEISEDNKKISPEDLMKYLSF